MGTSSVPQAGKYGYLLPCTHCGADNGMTATLCWRCDTALPSSGPPGIDALLGHQGPPPPGDPHDQSTAATHARHSAEGEPSFFPVLHEEVPGAANDGPSLGPLPDGLADDGPFARPPARTSRPTATWCLLAAGVLIAVIAFGPDLLEGPGAARTPAPTLAQMEPAAAAAPMQAAYQAPTVRSTAPPPMEVAPARIEPQVVAHTTAPPRRAAVATRQPVAPVVAPTRADVPAPAAPCTAAVIALGLCTPPSN